jgi:hypothetical protein
MAAAAPQRIQQTPCQAPPLSAYDTVRYDVAVDVDVDPTAAAAFHVPRCCCRSAAESPHDAGAVVRGTGCLAAVSLPVGDCHTTVYAMATGHGSWRLLILRVPGPLGACAALMAVTEQLRLALRHARLTPTHIVASFAPVQAPASFAPVQAPSAAHGTELTPHPGRS